MMKRPKNARQSRIIVLTDRRTVADFILHLRPVPKASAPPDVLRLRKLLKEVGRRHGLKCVSVVEVAEEPQDASVASADDTGTSGRKTRQKRNGGARRAVGARG